MLTDGCARAPNGGGGAGATDGGADSSTGTIQTQNHTLTISPASATLVLTAGQPPPTAQFTASYDGQSVNPSWSTDRGELGSIDANGRYTPLGTLGGKAQVRASYAGLMASASVTVQLVVSENGDPKFANPGPIGAGGYGGVGGNGPGGPVSDAQKATLMGAATADANVKLLYPYDGTVFPRGLLAPLLMWSPGSHSFDAVRVQMSAKGGTYAYDGYFSKPATGSSFINLPIPQATWTQMSYSASGDEVTVTLTFAQGTTATGPVTLKWVIAAGTLKGIVYYNSYGTALAANSGEPSCGPTDSGCSKKSNRTGPDFGGATLGIRPGATDPELVAGTNSADMTGCRVCHSVASCGNRLVTQTGDVYQTSKLIDLKNGNAESGLAAGDSAFPALFPDGTLSFTSSGGMINGDVSSRLYQLPSGTQLQPTGLPADLQAALPAFSPDGKNVIFNFYGGAGADQRSLATMTFSVSTLAFGPLTTVVTPTSGGETAVWPSFLPTSKGALFQIETGSSSWGYTWRGNRGHLSWVDLASKQAHALDRLNGVGYLPTSSLHPDDTTLNYEPTVNPVPSGGYAWVVFTSRRLYGNVATIDPFHSDPREYDWQNQITTKKLWVAAIDLNAQAGGDPSHPAFYLPAQELRAGNSRGFWTVDPCRADGASCETGDECCGGYCLQMSQADGGAALMCGSSKSSCAAEFERCNTDADCCQPGIDTVGQTLTCVNNFCSTASPPIL
jgi:hypothetical protein